MHLLDVRRNPVRSTRYSVQAYSVLRAAHPGQSCTGGKGKHRGGDGIRRVYEFTAPATMTVNSERRILAPYGLAGGRPGTSGVNRLVHDGETRSIGGKFTARVEVGDQVIIETPGGGGWGKA